MATATLGTAVLRTRMDLNGIQTGFRTAQQDAQRLAQNMTQIGRRMTLAITTPIVAIGASIVTVASQFEQSMNKVSALTGATGEEFEALRKQAADLGKTTVYSASQAADAMGFLAMAGLKTNEILGAMPSTLELAAAAQLDLADAADIVTNILTGYQLNVEDLDATVDVLTKAFVSANTNLGQLGEAMKFVAPVASSLGIELEETTAAIGMLSDAGIQGGMAGTTLRQIFIQLSDDAHKLGIDVWDAAGNMRPLVDIFGDIEKSGLSSAEILEFFGARAGPGMLALLSQGSKALEDFKHELEDSAGTAAEIAEKQLEGFRGKVVELKSAVEGLLISIGDAGLLSIATRLAEGLTNVVRRLDAMPAPLKAVAVGVGAVAAIAGPFLLTLGGIVRALPLITSGFVALRTVIAVASGPVGWLTLAAGAAAMLALRLGDSKKEADELASSADRLGANIDSLAESGRDGAAALGELEAATDEAGLRGAVQALASTMEGDAAASFVAFANQAIATGEDIDVVVGMIRANLATLRQEFIQTNLQTTEAALHAASESYQLAVANRQRAEQQGGLDPEYVARYDQAKDDLERELAVPPHLRTDAQERRIHQLETSIELMGQTIGNATGYLQGFVDAEEEARASVEHFANTYAALVAEQSQYDAWLRGEADSPYALMAPTVVDPKVTDGIDDTGTAVRDVTGAVDALQEALKGTYAWVDRLGEEFEVGLKSGVEVLDLITPRLDELYQERHDLVAAGQVGSFAHQVAVAKIAELEALEKFVTGTIRSVTLGLDASGEGRTVFEDLVDAVSARSAELDHIEHTEARRLENLVNVNERARADGEARRLENWEKLIGIVSADAVAKDLAELQENARRAILERNQADEAATRALEAQIEADYRAWANSADRQAAMRAAEVGGPSAGMATGLSRGNLAYQLSQATVAAREADIVKDVLKQMGDALAFAESQSQVFGDSFDIAATQIQVMRNALLAMLEAGLSPSHEAVVALKEELDAYEQGLYDQAQATQEATDREVRFAQALAWARNELGELPGPLDANIQILQDYRDGLDLTIEGAEELAKIIDKLLEGLLKLKKAQEEGASDLSSFAGEMRTAAGHMTGIAASFTRASASFADGLDLIQQGDKIQGITGIITGLTEAIEGVNTAIDNGMDANSVFDVIAGTGTIAAGAIGTLTGIPGLGEMAGAAFGLLKSIIGDLSDGMAEVNAELDEMGRRATYVGEEALAQFGDQFTRRVSKGGIAGSFGATKAELDTEAMNAAMDLFETFAGTFASALTSSNWEEALEEGFTDLIREKLVEAFILTPEMQALILEMKEFWDEAWSDGVWSEAEQAQWDRLLQRGVNMGRAARQQLEEAGMLDDAASRAPRRSGGSRITDLTGPARDHFSDLLAPLNVLPQGVGVLTQIRDILVNYTNMPPNAAAMGAPAMPGTFIVHGDVVVNSNATDIRQLTRDIAEAIRRQRRGQ